MSPWESTRYNVKIFEQAARNKTAVEPMGLYFMDLPRASLCTSCWGQNILFIAKVLVIIAASALSLLQCPPSLLRPRHQTLIDNSYLYKTTVEPIPFSTLLFAWFD